MSPANEKDQARFAYSDSKRSKRTFTNAEITKALNDAYTSLTITGPMGREAYHRYYDLHRGDVPHPFTVINRFGKWNEGLKAAKLPYLARKREPEFTDEDCIAGLLACRADLGSLPSVGKYEEWQHQEWIKHPSAATIRSKFGKWSKASAEALKHI